MLCVSALCTACSLFSSKQDEETTTWSKARKAMETEAQQRLNEARSQLQNRQFEAAKATIQAMRKDCYLALKARRQGILLMDTIDLRLAEKELNEVDHIIRQFPDSLSQDDFDEACRKVDFYKQKIKHDIEEAQEKGKKAQAKEK